MNKKFRYSPIALAVMSALPLFNAMAEPTGNNVTQTVVNTGTVSNDTDNISEPMIGNEGVDGSVPINLGTSASITIGATGAAASVSISAINTPLEYPVDSFNNITQTVNNEGSVTNAVALPDDYFDPVIVDLGAGTLGPGASVSASATGAVASVAVSAINDGTFVDGEGNLIDFSLQSFGNIIQADVGTSNYSTIDTDVVSGPVRGIKNIADVINNGKIENVGNLSDSATISVSAVGAVASVSTSFVAVYGTGVPNNVNSSNLGNVTQSVFNDGIINNKGEINLVDAAELGKAASVSISASGAMSSLSYNFVNSNLVGEWSLGDIVQFSENTALVTNEGQISGGNGSDLNRASSVAVTATGAVVSTAFSGVSNSFTMPETVAGFSVEQYAKNAASVSNSGSITGFDDLSNGDSVSLSATGAAASFGINTNSTELSLSTIGDIDQYAINGDSANVNNSGYIAVDNLSGLSASASISATGSVASFSVSSIQTSISSTRGDTLIQVGNINQTVSSMADVTNNGGVYEDGELIYRAISAGPLDEAASASVSATGAVASVNVSDVFTNNNSPIDFSGDIVQIVQSGDEEISPTISNKGNIAIEELYHSASASVSATGAVASVSFSAVYGGPVTLSSIDGGVTQTVTNFAKVQNEGSIYAFDLLGNDTSVGVNASGAVASLGISSNATDLNTSSTIGTTGVDAAFISQNVNNSGMVTNTTIDNHVVVGNLAGAGASSSISASGAVSSVSLNFTNNQDEPAVETFNLPAIQQTVTNNVTGNVSNSGTSTSGELSGAGASVSISASGAVASVAYNLNTTNFSNSYLNFREGITQTVTNYANVTNDGTINTADLSGHGASVSISASGAIASTSVSNIASNTSTSDIIFSGAITQTALNSSNVTNSGSIGVGGMIGKGGSVSITATGASASHSVGSVASDTSGQSVNIGSYTQSATNYGVVSNSGSISYNTGSAVSLGSGSNLAISATGAATSISFSAVK